MVRSGNLMGAAEVIRSANAMASVCGKVCPEEVFCQAACTRGKKDTPLAIRELHFHATQHEIRRGYSPLRPFVPNGKSVAIIGGGPAGLACAFELAKCGYRIDLYDRKAPGGVPRNTIPSYRLSEEEVRADVDLLSRYVDFHQENVDRGRFDEIRTRHDAIFIAVGLSVDRMLDIPGKDLHGVIPVLEFLESARGPSQGGVRGNKVVIVGGGNVSLDAAATAKRQGSREVTLLYRRGEREMRVWESELGEARDQGVQMLFLTNPVEILGPAHVRGIRCRRTRLSEKRDATDRPIPLDVEGSEFTLEADAVIPAIGQGPGADFLTLFDRTPQGFLKVDGTFATSHRGVFAGGDLVGGEGTIVQSVGHGKMAAGSIHRFLSEGAGA
jgi:glutamate synthase (NADPH/NADH) small chain